MFVQSGPQHDGTENGKHGNYGHVNPELKSFFTGIQNHLILENIYINLTVNSGYRCPYGNYLVTRKNKDEVYSLANQTSRHVIGKAVDILPKYNNDPDWNNATKEKIIRYVVELYNATLPLWGTAEPEAQKYTDKNHMHVAPPRGSYSRSAR